MVVATNAVGDQTGSEISGQRRLDYMRIHSTTENRFPVQVRFLAPLSSS